MNIAVLTLGTRGDVQPYLALSRGLERAGHSVTFGTSRDFAAEVAACGIRFAPFEFSIREILQDPDAAAAFQSKRAALRLQKKVAPKMSGLLDDAWKAAQGANAVVYHPKILNGLDIAEKLRIPAMLGFYLPALTPTRAFPAPFLPGPSTWGGFGNRLSHGIFLRLMTAPFHRQLNRWRAHALNLPRRPFWRETSQRFGLRVPKLYGYSRHLVPVPTDWDSSAHVTGQWFLDRPAEWHPPPGLEHFLDVHPLPLLVSFGSIFGSDPARTTQVVLEALRLSGQRAVLVGGWGGLRPANESPAVWFEQNIPYDWLLPRVSAAVHHGGAGSTGEAARAGIPMVVCPFFGDQPFWGRRVHELGIGPPPIPQKKLTATALAGAMAKAVSDPEMRRRAAELGQRVRAERGVEAAVRAIELETARAA